MSLNKNYAFCSALLSRAGKKSGENKKTIFSLPIRLLRVSRASPLDKDGIFSSDSVTPEHRSLPNQEALKNIKNGLEPQKKNDPMENKVSTTVECSQTNSSINKDPKVLPNSSFGSQKPFSLHLPLTLIPPINPKTNSNTRAGPDNGIYSPTKYDNGVEYKSMLNAKTPAGSESLLSDLKKEEGSMASMASMALQSRRPSIARASATVFARGEDEGFDGSTSSDVDPSKGQRHRSPGHRIANYYASVFGHRAPDHRRGEDEKKRFAGSRREGGNISDFGAPWPLPGLRPRTRRGLNEPPAFEEATNKVSYGKSSLLRKQEQEVVSITYEEIGLFPRSFSRVLDRFLKQVFSDVENLVIQEYRFYRYLFLTTLKCLLILFFVPFFVNFLAKTYVVRPLTEYFWNTKQSEIFLNSYQQKRAFSELKEFEEKTYFESLIFPKSVFTPNITIPLSFSDNNEKNNNEKNNENSNELKDDNNQKVEASSSKIGSFSIINNGPVTGPNLAADLTANSAFFLNVDSKTLEPTVYKGDTMGIQPRTEIDEVKIASYNSTPLESLIEKIDREGKNIKNESKVNTELLINSYSMKSSLFVYQTQEAGKNMQQRYQEKTIELAQRYNDQSIEAITNFFADLISLLTLFYLLYALEIQINITKSFLLEVFFGLDDSKKSLLILLITDLLVGYHSSNLWELFFEFLFHHYGLPESQTGIFLLVATLPVLLDVLFKYLIFRHLNRSSPATVATYHAMIE